MVKSQCLCLSFCHQSLPGVEFSKGVFNFNFFTNVPALVRSCFLETPMPNLDALFTDCTIEFSKVVLVFVLFRPEEDKQNDIGSIVFVTRSSCFITQEEADEMQTLTETLLKDLFKSILICALNKKNSY
jgi:hypothetical protein